MKVLLNQTYTGKVIQVDRNTCTVSIQGLEPSVHTYMKSELGGQLPEPNAEILAMVTIISSSPNSPKRKRIRKKLKIR